MLKLEPTEAENCLLAVANGNGRMQALSKEMDILMRAGDDLKATELADRTLLRDSLGLDERDCKMLADGARLLMNRRTTRGDRV